MHDIKCRFSNDERLTSRYIQKVGQGELACQLSCSRFLIAVGTDA
jgi:hypothetical protein